MTFHQTENITKSNINNNNGCNIKGSFITDKLGGDFKFQTKYESANKINELGLFDNMNNDNTQLR